MINPYNWNSARPGPPILRGDLVQDTALHLRSGQPGYVLGGHGMGKSVFLRLLQRELEEGGAKVLLFSEPPVVATLQGALDEIAQGLSVAAQPGVSVTSLVERFLAQSPTHQQVVLLYDEIDQYPTLPDGHLSLAKLLLDRVSTAIQELSRRLSALVAGGLGIYALGERSFMGSPFINRAREVPLFPLSRAEMLELAGPLMAHQATVPPEQWEEILESIYLHSGGNPALSAYGLQHLWDQSPSRAAVERLFQEFQRRNHQFVRSFRDSVGRTNGRGAPIALWRYFSSTPGPYPLTELRRRVAEERIEDVLRLLRSSGIIEIEEPLFSDPVRATLIPSVITLNLPEEARSLATIRAQFRDDLRQFLHLCFSYRPGLVREDNRKGPRQLLWEKNYAAMLAIYMETRGWLVDMESMVGAGYVDVRLRHPRFGQQNVVLELKIWENQKGPERKAHFQPQAEGYWNEHTQDAVVLVIRGTPASNWPEDYREVCLSEPGLQVIASDPAPPPLTGQFTIRSRTPQGYEAVIDHLLLDLSGR